MQPFNPIEERRSQVALAIVSVAAGVGLAAALLYGVGFAVAAALVALGLVTLVGVIAAPPISIVHLDTPPAQPKDE